MRRFLVTSPKFTGEVELIYNASGAIDIINMQHTDMDFENRARFKTAVPVAVKNIESNAHTLLSCTIVEADFEVTLADFKRDYPYQRNMHLLPPIWDKMDKSEQVIAWAAGREYRKYCERNSSWYKPKIAAAWLKAKEYLNDWKNL